jgi:hypothetical protein
VIVPIPIIDRQTGFAQPWVAEVGYKTFEEATHAALETSMNAWSLTLKNSPNQYYVQQPVFLTDQPGNKVRVLVPYLLWIPPPAPL